MPNDYNTFYFGEEEDEDEPVTAHSKKSYATNITQVPQQQPLTALLQTPPYTSPQHMPIPVNPIAPDLGNPNEPYIISSQDFRVSLQGDEGPEEFRDVASAADKLTGFYEDSRYLDLQRDTLYLGGGAYRPIDFGVPNYTGDMGYPVVDPNPGNCKPNYIRDRFGRCVHISWFNLPPPPSGQPTWTSGEGSDPINGVCPNGMYLANNNKCYSYAAPPNYLPPPPAPTTSGTNTSGSSNFAAISQMGRVYNQSFATSNKGYNNMNKPNGNSNQCRIEYAKIERHNVNAGDRDTIDTTVQLFNVASEYRVRVIVPEIGFKTQSEIIPVEYPGIRETVQTDFVIPDDTETGLYKGQIQLWNGPTFRDSVNFSINVT